MNTNKIPVTFRAGLEEMKPSERRRVIQTLLQGTKYHHHNAIKQNQPIATSVTPLNIIDNHDPVLGLGGLYPIGAQQVIDSSSDYRNSGVSSVNDGKAPVCSICLFPCNETDSETIAVPSCKHTFHSDCILEWLLSSDHCPYCRAEIMEPGGLLEMAENVLGSNRVMELKSKAIMKTLTTIDNNNSLLGLGGLYPIRV